MNTQQRFTDAVQKIADDNDLELAVDTSYANVGTYSFCRAGVFAPVARINFNFQNGHASFDGDIGRRSYVTARPDDQYPTLDDVLREVEVCVLNAAASPVS